MTHQAFCVSCTTPYGTPPGGTPQRRVSRPGRAAGGRTNPVDIYRKNYIIFSVEAFDLTGALRRLGELLREPVLLIVGGGGSAILCRWLDRPTLDLDVLASEPALGAPFRAAVVQVADEQGLPAAWINDGAKAYAEVLPPDFRSRLIAVGVYGRLTVQALGRPDWILLKLFALRAEDVADLRALAPTPTELAFVRRELPRIARFHAARAHGMELYLQQGEVP